MLFSIFVALLDSAILWGADEPAKSGSSELIQKVPASNGQAESNDLKKSSNAEPDVLITVASIRLEPAQPKTIKTVRLQGVVTFVHNERAIFYLNDPTGSTAVALSDERLSLPSVGDQLTITGTTAPGTIFPIVRANSLRKEGSAELPAAKKISFSQGMSGTEDAQWVVLSGQLLRNEALGTWQRLTLATPEGEFTVSIPSVRQHSSAPGANLSVRGVCTVWTQRGSNKIGGFFLFCPSLSEATTIPADPTALSVLIRTRQVQSLRAEQAHAGQPVALRGVVTFVHPDQHVFYLNDSTGGVLVWPADRKSPLPSIGDMVSVSGVSSRGAVMASVRADKIEVAGTQMLPAPRSISLEQAMTGSEDGQWVEMYGHLRQIDVAGNWLRLNLTAAAGEFTVSIPRAVSTDIKVGTYILVRGVCQAWLDAKQKIGGVFLYTPTLDDLKVAEAPPSDPFDVPEDTIANLPLYRTQTLQRLQVRIRGSVLYHAPGRYLVVENESGVVRAFSPDENPLTPGDRVDVAGIPGRMGNLSVLRAAIYRRVSSGPAPQPLELADKWEANPNLEGRLVTTTGQLLNVLAAAGDTRLLLQTAQPLLELVHKGPLPAQLVADWTVGSTLKVSGLYCVEYDENDRPTRFSIQLRSSADVVVLAHAPWWTIRRALTSLGLIAVCLVLGLTWVFALRRRVRQQTVVIRAQLEKEANLEAQHRQIVENASDLIFTTNLEGQFTSFNPAGERVTGYTPTEALALRFTDLLSPEDAATAETFLSLAHRPDPGPDAHFETRFRTRDGRLVWVETNARQIREAGKLTGLLGISRNISERKEMEAQKKHLDALSRHIQKTESLGRMAAAVAHNFNNQLQSIIMGLQVALNELPATSEMAGILNTSLNSANKASQIGGLMLTYLGQTPGKLSLLNLSAITQKSLQQLRTSLPRTFQIESSLATPGPVIEGGADQIEQILPNLVANAAESYVTARGVIRVSVTQVAAHDIPTLHRFPLDSALHAAAYACLSVADEGCGLHEESLGEIFDPFFTTKFHGRGMGLAVVMGVARAHDGVIVVESTPGKGSHFRIYFPIATSTT